MKYTIPLLLVLCGCRALDNVRTVGPVEVRAVNARLADRVARSVPRALEAIGELQGAIVPGRVLILVRGSDSGGSHGRSYSDRIELEIDPDLESFAWVGLDLLVTHELAHSCMPAGWNRLPVVIEEGVADVIAQSVEPRVRPAFVDQETGDLDISREVFAELEPAERAAITALGSQMVRRLGFERIQEFVDGSPGRPVPLGRILMALQEAPR